VSPSRRLPTLPRFLGNQQYIVGTVKGRLTVQPQRLRLATSASSSALSDHFVTVGIAFFPTLTCRQTVNGWWAGGPVGSVSLDARL
jgi:hypothetical protein